MFLCKKDPPEISALFGDFCFVNPICNNCTISSGGSFRISLLFGVRLSALTKPIKVLDLRIDLLNLMKNSPRN
jgi:hypothetical protein